jgi:hypothetical protein
VIAVEDLRKIARARLADAEALFQAARYDGAAYLAGYAIELSLKYRICMTLRWREFPSTANEFQRMQSFKSHNLDALLHLCGRGARIRERMIDEWSTVSTWTPESRYTLVGGVSRADAERMLGAVKALVKVL